MAPHTHHGPLFWTVPFSVVAGLAYLSVHASKHRAATAHPLKFVPSGEPSHDSEALERVRADWKRRNNGIGLRDVSRSGGGV
ncbi:hypothetical protein VTP01DRAFT_1198 [Rhizomucor pusillus]|uniref:uncharacterized protein n=1 Tax=Rhizomucor pusillus TaxID=4840 RepID=UPI0037436538